MKEQYLSPKITVVKMMVEQGFQASNDVFRTKTILPEGDIHTEKLFERSSDQGGYFQI